MAVLIAASIAAGQAILSLCGRRESSWLAGPVGLAAILVVGGIAIKLPGHGIAVAIALAVLFVLSLVSLAWRGRVAGTGLHDAPRREEPRVSDVPDPTPNDPTDPEVPTDPVPRDPTEPASEPGVFDPGAQPESPVAAAP